MNCTICEELIGVGESIGNKSYKKLVESGKTKILETDNFVILPSVGPLNRSHVLIVPKTHILSFASIPKNCSDELNAIKSRLRNYVKEKENQKLIFFEHGTGVEQDLSGGCVAHAHLHAVFSGKDGLEATLKEDVLFEKINPDDLALNADTKYGYVTFENTSGHFFLANRPKIPPQYFRYKYGKINSEVEVWNWRNFLNKQGILDVIQFFHQL